MSKAKEHLKQVLLLMQIGAGHIQRPGGSRRDKNTDNDCMELLRAYTEAVITEYNKECFRSDVIVTPELFITKLFQEDEP